MSKAAMPMNLPGNRFDKTFWRKLTCLRGLLAFYVVLAHTRNAFWPALKDIPSHPVFSAALTYAVGAGLKYGTHAVFLFFLVSGLSIHAGQLNQEGRAFDTLDFFKRRCRRLMPPLLASFLSNGILFSVCLGHDFCKDIPNLVGTLFFQQTVLTSVFAGSDPYWSLANEGYYYAAYPILWLALRTWGLAATFVAGIIASALVAWTAPVGLARIAAYYPMWLMGLVLAELLWRRKSLPVTVLLGMFFIVALSLGTPYMWTSASRQQEWLWNATFGMALVSVVYLWLLAVPSKLPACLNQALLFLGNISYSLYLSHYLVVATIHHYAPSAVKTSLLLTTVFSLMAAGFSVVVAYILYLMAESPFSVRRENSSTSPAGHA